MRAPFRLAASLILLATCSPAYYYFTHLTREGRPYYEKFDLNALPGRTLNYFVEDGSRVQLAPNDSFPSLLSQIRSAARVWNDVETSDLRVVFSGIAPRGQSTGPAMEILFDEVPPGVVAYGGPAVRADATILRSVVVINADLTKRPSYSESLFGTLVHEIGHALGLQHSLTSGTMSTATTRATSKARPLAADDIAAISVLYPRGSYLAGTASISGRITYQNGAGVNLASVVAISPNGPAIGTLSNPDGTWRIDGLPPRAYFVYAHPLPPPREGQSTPADVVFPVDVEGKPVPAGAPFESVFFGPGGAVRDAVAVNAVAGAVTENINFSVRQRSGYAAHSVETWAFPGSFAVRPAYLYPGSRQLVVATGTGIVNASGSQVGAAVNVLGGGTLAVRPYPQAPAAYLQIDVPAQAPVAGEAPRHLVFTSGTDMYVLPYAYFNVERAAPQIGGVVAAPEVGVRGVAVLATNVGPNTRILFDGVDAVVRSVDDAGSGAFRILVTAPLAPAGHRAAVVALNPDGQSSLFVQSEPATWVYPAETPQLAFAVTPNMLPAGVEATVQIDGFNTQFQEGQVSVGFGTSDVTVRRVWVVSPTRLLVSVATASGLQQSALTPTVTSGLQMVSAPGTVLATGPQPRAFWLNAPVAAASAGSPVTLTVGSSPVPLTPANVAVFVNDARANLMTVAGGQVTFQIPPGVPPGPATVRLEAAGERSLNTVVQVEPAVFRILTSMSGTSLGIPIVMVEVQNLGDKPITVSVNGKETKVVQISRDGDRTRVIVELSELLPPGLRVPVIVSTDGRATEPFSLTIGA